MATNAAPRTRRTDSVIPLEVGWEAAPSASDGPSSQDDLDGLAWLPARVPGTFADVLREAG